MNIIDAVFIEFENGVEIVVKVIAIHCNGFVGHSVFPVGAWGPGKKLFFGNNKKSSDGLSFVHKVLSPIPPRYIHNWDPQELVKWRKNNANQK